VTPEGRSWRCAFSHRALANLGLTRKKDGPRERARTRRRSAFAMALRATSPVLRVSTAPSLLRRERRESLDGSRLRARAQWATRHRERTKELGRQRHRCRVSHRLGHRRAVLSAREHERRVGMTAYVEQVLCPELRDGDVVIMDNLAAPQKPSRPRVHRGARRGPSFSSAILAGPEPDRAGVVENEGAPPKARGSDLRHAPRWCRRRSPSHHPARPLFLLQRLRLRPMSATAPLVADQRHGKPR